MTWWAQWRQKYAKLVEEYGAAAIWTYLALFALTLVGFYAAIRMGVEVEGAAASAGMIGSAYLATKMTQPLRIAATAVLTPAMVAVWRRIRRTPADAAPPPA